MSEKISTNLVEASSSQIEKNSKKRFIWDKETVIKALKDLPEGGIIYKNMVKFNGPLYQAAVAYFGNWPSARTAAGLNKEKLPPKWSKAIILKELQNIPEGQRSPWQIKVSNTGLYQAVKKYFESFDAAISEAGLISERVPIQRWSAQSMTEYVRGLPKGERNYNSVPSGIVQAAIKLFGNWNNTLISAGHDPNEETRQSEGPKSGNTFEYLVRDLFKIILPELKYKVSVDDCIPDWIYEDHKTWVDTKLRSCGADVDSTIDKYLQKTEKLVIVYLIGRKTETNRTAIQGRVEFKHISEFENLAKCPDSKRILYKILSMEGKPYIARDDHVKCWSEDRIIKDITSLPEDKRSSWEAQILNAALYSAAKAHFGSWGKALTACGLSHELYWKGGIHWTENLVVQEIKNLPEYSRNSSSVLITFPGLLRAAKVRFGSWDAAVSASGIDPNTVRKAKKTNRRSKNNRKWTPELVVACLKSLPPGSRNAKSIEKSDISLYVNCRTVFGSLSAAMSAANLPFEKLQGGRKPKLLL